MAMPETPEQEVKRKLKEIGSKVNKVVKNLDDNLIHGIAELSDNKTAQKIAKGILKTWRDVLKEIEKENKKKS